MSFIQWGQFLCFKKRKSFQLKFAYQLKGIMNDNQITNKRLKELDWQNNQLNKKNSLI